MPKSIDELLALAAEGDEEAQAEIKNLFQTQARTAAIAQRDLKLKTDKTLMDRYPRALKNWEKGHLRFGDDVSEADMVAMLRAKEDELADMGVPIDTSPTAVTGQTAESAAGDATNDPAQALAGAHATSGPGGQVHDVAAEAINQLLRGTTRQDHYNAFAKIAQLNQTGKKDEIERITQALEATPIIPR